MDAKDVHISATTQAQKELKFMLETCSTETDCLHIGFADASEYRVPDGRLISSRGPHWFVAWNKTEDVGDEPYWVTCGEFSLFFPQFWLYEKVSGKVLHFSDDGWSFIEH